MKKNQSRESPYELQETIRGNILGIVEVPKEKRWRKGKFT